MKRRRFLQISQQEAGFTLVEVLVVVAIIAILTLVAYPAYQDQMQKTRRSDAKIALTELANREEKFLADNARYTATITGTPGLGYTTSVSPDKYYSLAIATPSNTEFTATATPVATGPQAGDQKCTSFAINHRGEKTFTGSGPTCW